jgi:PAS domain S-box-containing protein
MNPTDSVLIVTGQIATAKACSQSLQRAGQRVVTVPNVTSALNTLKAGGVDCVVFDPPLTPATGLAEFCRSLRGAGCDLPVLLLADPADTDGARLALEAGAREVLRKSVSYAEHLPDAVARLRRQAEQEKSGRRAGREMEALRRSTAAVRVIAKNVSRGDTLERVLAGAAEQMIAIHDLNWVTIWLADPAGVQRCRVNLRVQGNGRLGNPSVPLPVDPATLALEEGRLLLNDLQDDARFPPGWAGTEGMRGFIALELPGPQGRLGLIAAMSHLPVAENVLEAIEPMAALLALAVRSSRDGEVEQRLRTRMHATLESMNSGLIGFDPEGRITYASAAAGELLGRPAGALAGMALAAALYGANARGEDVKRAEEFRQVVATGWPVSHESDSFVRADGGRISVAYKVLPLTEAGERVGGILAFRDISAQLQAQALENSARRLYQTLVEQSPDLVISTDTSGIIVYANPSVRGVLGYEPDEIIGKPFNDYLAAEPAQAVNSRLSRIMKVTRGKATELPFRHKSGQTRYIAWTCYPLLDPQGLVIGGQAVGRDTTERHHVESELIESEARYRRLLEAALEGIMIVSAVDGRVLDANPSLLEMLGVAAGEFIGRPLWEIPAFSLVFSDAAAVDRLGRQPATRCEELPLKTRDGSILYAEFNSQSTRADGEPLITCNGRDVSELKRQMAGGRRQAEQLRLLNEISRIINERLDLSSALNVILDQIDLQLPDSFSCVVDRHEESGRLTVLAVNSALQGLARQAGLEVGQALEPGDSALGECLTAQAPAYLPELAASPASLDRQLAAQGLGAALAVPLVVEGTSIGLLMICRQEAASIEQEEINFAEQIANNIGAALRNARHRRDLKAAYDELKATQQQAIVQERLRALGTMASGVAHDLNNALAPIVGFAEMIIDRPEILADRPKALHYLDMIRTCAVDGATVVSQLREFYRQRDDAEAFAPLDLNEVIRKTLELTAPRWKDIALSQGAEIRVVTELGKLPQVLASESELRQMLTNLVINAADAMPRGGTLSFRTRAGADGALRMEISDTGTGMTPEVRARCLEPFFTTKGEQGTGMGLAMVYGILTRHGGKLDIQSAPGTGTSFIITLPAAAARAPAPAARPAAAAPARPLHILLADDEARVREMVSESLRGDGHLVETAGNGEEALRLFRPGAFDLVLTDKAMPKLNGEHLARQIKATPRPPPVILLTGFGDMMQAAGEMPEGVDLILSKPVSIHRLREAIASLTAVALADGALAGDAGRALTLAS